MSNTTKIAVFAKARDFNDLELIPKDMFVRIKNSHSIHGCKFSGIIHTFGWWEIKELTTAYEDLRRRQPELFNKTKINHEKND